MSKIFPFREEHQKLFDDVVFLVEADSYAQHSLWNDYHYQPKSPNRAIKNWNQIISGHGVHVGVVEDLPVIVSINYAILNGKKVLFYYGCSQVVDHIMIEKWLKHFTSNIVRRNDQENWAQCDANNFHDCFREVSE